MGKANWFWNTRDRQWELRDGSGSPIFTAGNGGLNVPSYAAIRALNVGGTGTFNTLQTQSLKVKLGNTLTKIVAISGTIPAVAAIGSGAITTVTLTNVGSGNIAVTDLLLGRADAVISGHIGIVGQMIATTNVVNILLANTKPDSAGSFPGVGYTGVIIGYT